MIVWHEPMGLHEIVLPITEPETEWVRGRALQKVSPTRSHALLQAEFVAALRSWAGRRGEVGPEWRFRVAPPGEAVRPLIPDVAYVAVERLYGLEGRELETPQLSPDVAVEVLSSDDRRLDVDDKVVTYLAAGSTLVVIVDPQARTVELHDGSASKVVREDETLEHPALPGFALSVAALFRTIDPPRRPTPLA